MADARFLAGNSLAPLFPIGLMLACPQAHAQDAMSIQVSGTLSATCSATVPGDQTINPASNQPQSIGTTGLQCNFAGIPTLRFWSTGSGKLVAASSPANGNVAQSLPYQLIYDGTVVGQLTGNSGSALPINRSVSPGTQRQGTVSIQIGTPASVAGTYTDTIFLAVAP